MLSTSLEFRRTIAENTKVELKATLMLADGGVVALTGDDFVMGGMSVTQATSGAGSFDVGAAVMGSCDLTLANFDQRFDEYDFDGAVLLPYAGVELESGAVEWLCLGTYGVEQPESYGFTISLHCLDNLRLLAVPATGLGLTYPASLGAIASAVLAHCGVTLATPSFPGSGYVVDAEPQDDGMTCLDLLSYVAQVAGCFVTCDTQGRCSIRWYDTGAWEAEDWLDGGSFDGDLTPYEDGDVADGGTFMDGGDRVEGGTFDAAMLYSLSTLTVNTDDVLVTGVSVTSAPEVSEDGTVGEDGETALVGSEGYVLSIEGNPLVEHGRAAEVARQVASSVVGMRFRPFRGSGIASPAWQAGDPIVVTDAMQRTYRSWLTSYTWKAGAYASMACDAAPAARNGAAQGGSSTRSSVALRRGLQAEGAARSEAIGQLREGFTGTYRGADFSVTFLEGRLVRIDSDPNGHFVASR